MTTALKHDATHQPRTQSAASPTPLRAADWNGRVTRAGDQLSIHPSVPDQPEPETVSGGASAWELRWQPRRDPIPPAYLRLAQHYERHAEMYPGWRDTLAKRLSPRRGDTVIDVECGSGLNFAALRAAVGPTGTIIGLDNSAELLTVAAYQVSLRGWDNIELINAPVETAQLALRADAALFAPAPHALASPSAVSNILGHLRAGAVIAAGGWKWPTRSLWRWPLRVCLAALYHAYDADTSTLHQPWKHLAEYSTGLRITEIGFGTGYLALAHAHA